MIPMMEIILLRSGRLRGRNSLNAIRVTQPNLGGREHSSNRGLLSFHLNLTPDKRRWRAESASPRSLAPWLPESLPSPTARTPRGQRVQLVGQHARRDAEDQLRVWRQLVEARPARRAPLPASRPARGPDPTADASAFVRCPRTPMAPPEKRAAVRASMRFPAGKHSQSQGKARYRPRNPPLIKHSPLRAEAWGRVAGLCLRRRQ